MSVFGDQQYLREETGAFHRFSETPLDQEDVNY